MTSHLYTSQKEITELAERVLGNAEVAQWGLIQPALALDGARPAHLISSPEGLQSVQELLMRIEYGVYC